MYCFAQCNVIMCVYITLDTISKEEFGLWRVPDTEKDTDKRNLSLDYCNSLLIYFVLVKLLFDKCYIFIFTLCWLFEIFFYIIFILYIDIFRTGYYCKKIQRGGRRLLGKPRGFADLLTKWRNKSPVVRELSVYPTSWAGWVWRASRAQE